MTRRTRAERIVWSALAVTARNCVSPIVPRKSAAISPAMASIVWLAWRVSGGLKTGTPLLIDSMPVRAVQPAEKVCSTSNRPTGCAAGGATAASGAAPSKAIRTRPAAISAR